MVPVLRNGDHVQGWLRQKPVHPPFRGTPGRLQMQPRISISDYDAQVAPERYTNLLHAGAADWDLYRAVPPRALHTFRLLVRGIRQCIGGCTTRSLPRRRFLRKRLCTTRRERLRQWKQASAERNRLLFHEAGTAEQKGGGG